MKKCLMSMLALMMVAAVSLCFVSCGDDDDDPKISIVGTWTFDYGDEGYCTLTFSGTATSGTMTIVSNEVSTRKLPAIPIRTENSTSQI